MWHLVYLYYMVWINYYNWENYYPNEKNKNLKFDYYVKIIIIKNNFINKQVYN